MNFSFLKPCYQVGFVCEYKKIQLELFKIEICTYSLLIDAVSSSEIACNLSNSCYNQQVMLSINATGYLKTEYEPLTLKKSKCRRLGYQWKCLQFGLVTNTHQLESHFIQCAVNTLLW